MRSREALALSLVLTIALAVNAVAAAPAAKVAETRAARATSAVAAKPDSSATSRTSASRKVTVAKAPAATSRRLDVTHIQGDIPVPQVLFVTARDQRRFMSAHHQKYLKSSRTLAESTPIPTRMIVARGETSEAGR